MGKGQVGICGVTGFSEGFRKTGAGQPKVEGGSCRKKSKIFLDGFAGFFFSFPCAPRSSYRKIYIPQFYIFPSERGHFFDFELRPNSTSKSWSSSPYAGTPAYCNANLSCIGPTHSSYLSEISGNAISSAFAALQPRTDLRKAFQRQSVETPTDPRSSPGQGPISFGNARPLFSVTNNLKLLRSPQHLRSSSDASGSRSLYFHLNI